jgi:hypothetical protein
MYLLIMMMLGHWIADFLLQNSWMADNKSTKLYPLMVHCLFYALFMSAYITAAHNVHWWGLSSWNVTTILYVITLFWFTHFVIDYCTSKITHAAFKKGKIRFLFNTVGFDQFLHFLVIVYVIHYF